jgi:hypothetical protein
MILDPVPLPGHSQPAAGTSADALVAQHHDAVAEVVVSISRRSAGVSSGPEQPPSGAHEHRVHVDPVLVDQIQPAEGVRQVGAAHHRVAARRGLQAPHLVRRTSRAIVVFRSARSSVRE